MNKVLKRTALGLAGFGAIGGATAVAVSCGASQKVYEFKVYSYSYQPDTVKYSRTTKDLRLWIPFANDAKNVYYPMLQAVKKVLEDAGYKVATIEDSSAGKVTYKNAANVFSTRVSSREYQLLPDVVINYPDLQALFVEKGLAQEFDLTKAKAAITEGLRFDITSVLAPEEKAYALPISKSSELTYFNVPAFAMVLNDIADQKTATDKITFPADSAQDRMARMIKNSATNNTDVHTGIYAHQTTATEYNWSDFKTYWTNLTKSGALWEEDAKELKKNFRLNDKARLLDFDLSKDTVFSTYKGLAEYVAKTSAAYNFDRATREKAILGVDTSANTLYAYQYDVAGHSQGNFIVKANRDVNPPQIQFDYRDTMTTGTGDNVTTTYTPTYQAFKYMSDLQSSQAVYIRDQSVEPSIYATDLLKKHQMFMAWRSSSGAGVVAAAPTDSKALVNEGELYFDYQPTKAGIEGEVDRKTIINQGPSIFVSKVNSESAKIAEAILNAFSAGGAFASKIVNNKDEGMFSSSGSTSGSVGYIYTTASDYQANSLFLQNIRAGIASSADWKNNIGKYLVAEHYAKAVAEPTKYDAFANPAGNGTSIARDQIDQVFLSANQNNSTIDAAAAMQAVLRVLVPDGRLR